jgi:hypothetical protein
MPKGKGETIAYRGEVYCGAVEIFERIGTYEPYTTTSESSVSWQGI